MEIDGSSTYLINADRIKEIAKLRKISIAKLCKGVPFNFQERSLRRNLADGKMRGYTLLSISKTLNCTPFYFMEPSPLGFFSEVPLEYWHYEIQELTLTETRYQFLMIRGMSPKEIEELTQDEIDEIEALVEKIKQKHRENTELQIKPNTERVEGGIVSKNNHKPDSSTKGNRPGQ